MKHLIEAVIRHSGLQIHQGNLESLHRHIKKRIRELGLTRPDDFLDCLEPGNPRHDQEQGLLVELITTGETFFMRDAGQMQLLRDTLLPDLLAHRRRQGQLRLRLWSCACATGEEAYSLAILLHELLPDRRQWHIDLFGTDVNRTALRQAQAGIFGSWAFRGCDEEFRLCYFQPHGGDWILRDAIREMVKFLPCDLLRDKLPDPNLGLSEMDLILCRNLFIYLEPGAIASASQKLADSLAQDGWLMTGHGELRQGKPDQLHVKMYPHSLVYRKGKETAPAPLIKEKERTSSGREYSPRVPPPPVRISCSSATGQPLSSFERIPLANDVVDRGDPKDAALAWRLADAGRLQEAQDLCRRLGALNPMQAELHFLAAVLSQELGESGLIRESLRKAIYLDPGLIAAHVHLERLQTDANELQAASKTREAIFRLLDRLPADEPVPYMGDTLVGELRSHLVSLLTLAPSQGRP